MNRPILSDNANAQQTIEENQVAVTTPHAAANEANTKPNTLQIDTERQDVLAGTLPDWDLVPQAQFVKRVKRSEISSGN